MIVKTLKYALNMDMCPISDEVLTQATCIGCEYYHDFSLENGLPCIECKYYADVESEIGE